MTWIRQKLAACGDRIVCHEAGKAWSYAEFIELIDQTATQVPSKGGAVIEVQLNNCNWLRAYCATIYLCLYF